MINLELGTMISTNMESATLTGTATTRIINQTFNEYGSITARNFAPKKPQLFNSIKKYEYMDERGARASRSPKAKEDAFHNFLKRNCEGAERKRGLSEHNAVFDRK